MNDVVNDIWVWWTM